MTASSLLDEKLSPRPVNCLSMQFPGSIHVRDVELKVESDEKIWSFAAKNGFIITTKDDDFQNLSLLLGVPPKVIWLVVGNTSTAGTPHSRQPRRSHQEARASGLSPAKSSRAAAHASPVVAQRTPASRGRNARSGEVPRQLREE